MTELEQKYADELDAFLTAVLQGQQPAFPTDLPEGEAQLAADLLHLAAQLEPDPVFLSGLETQLLAQTVSRPPLTHRQHLPERPSFWQQFLENVKDSLTMKRTIFSLGAIAAVLLLAVFSWNMFRAAQPEPGAEIIASVDPTAVDPTPVEPTVVDPAAVEPTVDPAAVDVETPAETEPIDTASLPKLPALAGAGGAGGGFGGGGGGDGAPATSQEATADITIDGPRFWDPLVDATVNLNAPLPSDPKVALAFQQPGSPLFTIDEVRQFVERFGLASDIYTDVYPVVEPATSDQQWTPPTFYHAFDGSRSLSVYDANMYYTDLSAMPDFSTAQPQPHPQAEAIAEAFLQQRGFLDFPYEMVRTPYTEVEFRRIIDGYVVTTSEFVVSVSPEGNVYSVSYNAMNKLVTLGHYPLRSAEEAWQLAMADELDPNRVSFGIYPGPDFVYPVYEPSPVGGLYKYWQRTYQEGQTLSLLGSPIVYRSVTDGVPRIQIDNFILNGSEQDLRGLAEQVGKQVRITGVAYPTSLTNYTLDVTGWEAIENIEYQSHIGIIRLVDGQTLFESETITETLLIPNAPTDQVDGERVYVNGWMIEEGSPYRVFNWQGMDRVVEFPTDEVAIEPTPPADFEDPYRITSVDINEVNLVYSWTYMYDEETATSTVVVQPVWRFKGMSDNRQIVEIYVQAVADELTQPAP